MAYVALYRKYRSQSFDELMGQEAVTTTLQNSIRSGRIAHAYLFHGARGCGKTSTARLLARALNCVATDGPTPEPCGICRICTAIRDGFCLDVVEIDAASETSIDDVREKIIENVQYVPAEARFKVYIIDEVHDLSAKAFDALLKTLEEPPAHVVFILATTEKHKVPITIRSRCQDYAFKRGSLPDLAASVQKVVDGEGFSADREAILSIARSAEGSWRDSLSLLEQVLSYSDGHITQETVHRAIGSVGSEILGRVVETLSHDSWENTLQIASELVESGTDVRQLLTSLSGFLRDLMMIAVARNAATLEMGEERVAALSSLAGLFAPPSLLAMMSELSRAEREIRFTNQHRWLLERTLLRLMPSQLQPAESLSGSPVAVREVIHTSARETVRPDRPASIHTPARIERPSAPKSVVPKTPAVPPAVTDIPGIPESPGLSAAGADRFAEAVTLEVVQRAWPQILARFEKISPAGTPFLKKAAVTGLEGSCVILTFPDQFSRDLIFNKAKGRARVEQVINEQLGANSYHIQCNVGLATAPEPETEALETVESELAGTLLDVAPVETVSQSSTYGDVTMDTSIPIRTEIEPPTKPVPAELKLEPERSLLDETLSIFGGEVVRTEPLTGDNR